MKKMYLKPVIEITEATAQPFMENISLGVKNGAKSGKGENGIDMYAKNYNVFAAETMWEIMD